MKKVRIVIDGEIFESVKSAAEFLEMRSDYLSKLLSEQKGEAKIKGFNVKRFTPKADDEYKIVCKETGEVFKSVYACAKALGVYSFNVYASIKNRGYYNKNGMTYYRLADNSPLAKVIDEKKLQLNKKVEQPKSKEVINKPTSIEKKVEEVKQLTVEQVLINTIKTMLDARDFHSAKVLIDIIEKNKGALK